MGEAEDLAGQGEPVIYQFREIGEGEGWRDCSKPNYDYFQRNPQMDTRTVPAPSGKALANENIRLRSALELAHNVLSNMVMRNEVGWRSIFSRWMIDQAMLRIDARAVLPIIKNALERSDGR